MSKQPEDIIADELANCVTAAVVSHRSKWARCIIELLDRHGFEIRRRKHKDEEKESPWA